MPDQGPSFTNGYGDTCNRTNGPYPIPDYKCPLGLYGNTPYGIQTEDATCTGSATMAMSAECPAGSTLNGGGRCETSQIAGGSSRYNYTCTGIGKCEGVNCSSNFVTTDVGANAFARWGGECNRVSGPSNPANVCPWGFTWNGTTCVSDFVPYCATDRPAVTGTITSTLNVTYSDPKARQQKFLFGGVVQVGDIYDVMVYSHGVYVVAKPGDTSATIASRLCSRLNATTATQWNDHKSAFGFGSWGQKPNCTGVSGSEITILLNLGNQFGSSVQ